MTYSIVGRCAETGQLVVATATSDTAVGARVPAALAGVGAVVTQHRTDPRLAPRMLALMSSGSTADEAVRGAVASTDDAAWRQLAAIGPVGAPSAWTGDRVDGERSTSVLGEDHAVVGNILASPAVGAAASVAFRYSAGRPLGERALLALEAGLIAGGEDGPLRSAAILVVADQSFPLVDLRVDDHDLPLAELRRLWELYWPAAGEYVSRALDPGAASGLSATEQA